MPHATPACVFGDCWRCSGWIGNGSERCEHDCHGHPAVQFVQATVPIEACDPTPDVLHHINVQSGEMWHEPMHFATDEDIQRWLDEPDTGPAVPVVNVLMLAAIVAVSVAIMVPLMAWLIHVGGWVRAIAGSVLAVLGLGYALSGRES